MLFIAAPLWFLHWPQGNGSLFLSSALISDNRTQISKKGHFLIRRHLYSSPFGSENEMNESDFNDYNSWWQRDSLVVLQGKSFPPGVNRVKTHSQVLLHQMGSGCDGNVFPRRWLCLWKMLVLEEDGLAPFERQAAGGTDALIFQQGFSCGVSWLFSA